MKNFIIIVTFTVSVAHCDSYGSEIDCSKHPAYCQIKKNKPRMSPHYAMKLSNLIHKASKKWGVPKRIYTAILKQESNYNLIAVKREKGVLEPRSFYPRPRIVNIAQDFGIAQINYITAQKYGYDLDRLLKDLEYSINAGAEVLSWFYKTYADKDDAWWSRFNCGTKRTTTRATCQRYLRDVSRWM